mgnify:CR=1 FL=1
MFEKLVLFLVLCPMAASAACMVLKGERPRTFLVGIASIALIAGALILLWLGPGQTSPAFMTGQTFASAIQVVDFLILGLIFYFGVKFNNRIIVLLSLAQTALLALFEFTILDSGHAGSSVLFVDNLSLIMICLICITGSLIIIFAVPYMTHHEAHLNLRSTRQPRFFALLFLFIGSMNALVAVNDMMLFYLFFEITTLCSFLLISHDATTEANKNAVTALWIGSLGGLALMAGIVLIYLNLHTLDIQAVVGSSDRSGAMMIPLGLLCIAGFTKAAQMPFQKWLLGAMVAPTPTSALLHSSTMVKAGIFLILRFAPSFEGTLLSSGVAICGAFTFLSGAALAIGQSNGKKVLAYSTISNLGLIIACIGINTHAALTAAVLLVIFHAVSKALLFLCVGTIEQHIGSRDIEDMRGLFGVMPKTAMIITLGILTMILPPFGMLLGKWMAIQSAAGNLLAILMLATGSALTVVYWARWAGILMGSDFEGISVTEHLSGGIRIPLMILLASAVALSISAPFIYSKMIYPGFAGEDAFSTALGVMSNAAGSFIVIPLFLIAMGVFMFALFRSAPEKENPLSKPYMSGISGKKNGTYIGPMNQVTGIVQSNYYLSAFFGEQKLSKTMNIAASMLIVLMLGVSLV